MRRGWAVLVVWRNGEQEYVHPGNSDDVAVFQSRRAAEEMRDSFAMGFDDGEVQSISVVRAP